MCNWGTNRVIRLNRPLEYSRRTEIAVDACIADEVQRLNDAGIWTLGCCCSHGHGYPSCLIHESSALLARSMGYDPKPYDGVVMEVALTDYEATYNDFWRSVVENPDGSLNPDKVKRELHDFRTLMRSASEVYDHVTGGRISKPLTDPACVIAEHDDAVRRAIDEERRDELATA